MGLRILNVWVGYDVIVCFVLRRWKKTRTRKVTKWDECKKIESIVRLLVGITREELSRGYVLKFIFILITVDYIRRSMSRLKQNATYFHIVLRCKYKKTRGIWWLILFVFLRQLSRGDGINLKVANHLICFKSQPFVRM